MSAIDKINNLIKELENGDPEVIKKFNKDFELFIKKYDQYKNK